MAQKRAEWMWAAGEEGVFLAPGLGADQIGTTLETQLEWLPQSSETPVLQGTQGICWGSASYSLGQGVEARWASISSPVKGNSCAHLESDKEEEG